jgi:NAD+ diphosphatase
MDYAFASCNFDRSVDRREDHQALTELALLARSAWIGIAEDGSTLITAGDELATVPGDRLEKLPESWAFLGVRENRPVFAASRGLDDEVAEADGGSRWMDLRSAAASLDAASAGILAYARALLAWLERHRHCGRCGERNRVEAGGHRLRCPTCDSVSFPRTDPAIIVAVRDGERCLLGRQAGWPAGRFSTLAGFVEPGETLEAAVVREVCEETGVDVGRCSYAGSQPWPFPMSLMLGFEASAHTTTITIGDELEDAQWFDPHDLRLAIAEGIVVMPPRLSISRWLIERWHRDVTGQPLPSRIRAKSDDR